MSQIKKTVRGFFEGRKGKDDMVNIIVFLRFNSHIYNMDAKLACKKYIEVLKQTFSKGN